MLFNSVTFVVFLLLVVPIFWILSPKLKMWLLLVASCVFYGFWRWEFLGVLFVSACTDFFTALEIERTPAGNKRRRKQLLALTLFVNLGLLLYFKYLFFFTENINDLFHQLGLAESIPVLNIILPFGISFYTFETISYTLDVYRGLIRAERNFLNYAVFVTFFPKLVAGPIQRYSELSAQLKLQPAFKWEHIAEGTKRILYGLFLKVFLADNISPYVNEVFAADASHVSAIDVWLMAFLFGFQVYFDFAGYSHIALGSARLMGIEVPENFNFPYLANSFKSFWKRWHISLSSWIRDYLYLPLAKIPVVRTTGSGGIGEGLERSNFQKSSTAALFLTWTIMGFWHGASWTFILWGFYHAVMVFLERALQPLRDKFRILNSRLLTWTVTLLLVMLSWIPFRAGSVTTSLTLLSKVVVPSNYLFYTMRENHYILAALLLILVLLTYFATMYIEPILRRNVRANFLFQTLKYTVIIVLVFTFLRQIDQFIYFQF